MRIFYSNRDLIAAVLAGGLILLLVLGGVREAVPLKPKYDTPVKLDMTEEPAPTPAPVVPVPAKALPVRPAAPREVSHVPPPPLPAKEPAQRPEPPRAAPSAVPVPQAVVAAANAAAAATAAPPGPAAAANKTADNGTAAAPAAAPAAPSSDNGESTYVGRIRAYLNSVKRYPTGRDASLQRPRGVVTVWFVLHRDGSLVDAGIERSSNSQLLDDAASKTVNRANFPAFPEIFEPGQPTHRFTVDLDFAPAG